MKNLLAVLFASMPFVLTAQDLIVAAGSQKTLNSAERTLSLKKLEIGDNAVIIIPPDMNGWTVTATDVTIGNNVKIYGQSTGGYNGMNGASGGFAPECKTGPAGGNGGNGAAGMAGKNITLNLKIRSIGSLTINVNGAPGGNGGYGGSGGKGGNASCICNAGNGGNGGYGGGGGKGGNGGIVQITYSKAGNADVSNAKFIVQNQGGANGVGGNPGAGGLGGSGGGCPDSKAALKPPGQNGVGGMHGANGLPGANGTTTITAK